MSVLEHPLPATITDIMQEEDVQALQTAVTTLEHPSFAARLAEIAGKLEAEIVHDEPRPGDVLRLYADMSQARELLGLTDTEAELLPHLRRGWALWKVGQRSFLVQHRLSSLEQEIVDTDARMAVRTAA